MVFPIDFLPGNRRSNGTELTHYRRSESRCAVGSLEPTGDLFVEVGHVLEAPPGQKGGLIKPLARSLTPLVLALGSLGLHSRTPTSRVPWKRWIDLAGHVGRHDQLIAQPARPGLGHGLTWSKDRHAAWNDPNRDDKRESTSLKVPQMTTPPGQRAQCIPSPGQPAVMSHPSAIV
jgi:hypothetical protein